MLEYALKQERAKFHKLKYGVELQQGDMKPPPPEDGEPETELPPSLTWRQGRQLIRQYFEVNIYMHILVPTFESFDFAVVFGFLEFTSLNEIVNVAGNRICRNCSRRPFE